MPSSSYKVGSHFTVNGRAGRIQRILGFDDFLVSWDDDHTVTSIKRWELDEEEQPARSKIRTRETATPDQIEEAERWYEACRPVIEVDRPPKELYAAAAKALGVHHVTIWRAVNRYRDNGQSIFALPRPPGNGGRGGVRLEKDVYAILQGVIDDFYLTLKSRSQKDTYEELKRRFKAAGLEHKTPHLNTLRFHLGKIPPRERVRRRKGNRAVREHMDPILGEFPLGTKPLQLIQVDHHICDVEVVDEEHRKTVGRPWLTLAIDAYSRMIVGLYLSLDHPCANNVGLCLLNAFLPKEGYLRSLNLELEWPVWGLCQHIHSDNGKEFRNRMLEEACRGRGMNTMFRPVKTPHYGAYIERMCGNVARWLKNVEGATYSNPKERGTEKRGGTPTMTLRELERWLVNRIVGIYHQEKHSGIGMPPAAKWHSYFFPEKGAPEPLPRKIPDPQKLRLEFMPSVHRTVQRYGLRINEIYYMADTLKHLIPEPGKKARSFKIHFDPAAMSPVWLFDPDEKVYHEVGYRDAARPVLTKWDLAAATRKVVEEGREVNENNIFEAAERQRQIEEEAAEKTKKARRNQARKKAHKDRPKPVELVAVSSLAPAPAESQPAAADENQPEALRPRRRFAVTFHD